MSFRTVATVDELVDDTPLACDVTDELTVAIVRQQGDLYAIEDECSHGKVALSEGDVYGCSIECYLHGSSFDLRTGAPLNPPATQPVRVFPVRLSGDDIQVDPDNPLSF
ncbi:non-heme iron oxygenase ferredoxin subunit [Tessaracoccus palaemonis]|uniref:Non-heme iron oxygenase ferredoxin subunit n=1 Tax=Tessaracoccus palaemonis TaxID=2829499 RepID=A0ABX8SEY9_9ACTN|nr:non-heme iron oxygenase ferredoxin subunit [Tessaracoccus palaemonis]QXT61966.1 non-heme iron oxygenase ferredoxin subunit [Tessaracoccus palaemonis]